MKAAVIALITLFIATAAFGQDDDAAPQRVPNHIKYQDNKPNAKGAGELATVETLALLDRWGNAQLEVTSDSPANITKVQLKLNDTTTNFNNLDQGSWFSLPLGNLARHTPFEAHVNVMGLNGGAEVVQVADVVRLQPDLDIEAIDTPGAVRLNQPFSIVATIRERNGDTGARTTCVLQDRDGLVLDRADNIWVDAGDSVQCIFSQTLDTLGSKTFFVKLDNTRPFDWDTSFEMRGFSILGTTDKQWELSAIQRTIRTTYVETFSGHPHIPTSGESTETVDRMLFSAVIDQPLDLNTIHMAAEETTDGDLIYRYPSAASFPPPGEENCTASDRRHVVYQLCRFEGGLAMDIVSVGTSALYVSRFWAHRFDPETGADVYTLRTQSRTSKFGAFLRYGSNYQLSISLWDDANHSWSLSPLVNLVPYENPVEHTTTVRDAGGGYTYTTESTYQETGKRGFASQE